MSQQKFDKFVNKNPHHHLTFFNRPHWTRRQFFQIAGAGVTGSYLANRAIAAETTSQPSVVTQNKAQNVIFILLTGAISHTDTFDLKVVNGVTPSNFSPTIVNGTAWPTGLLPKLGQQLPNMAIVRSVHAWALVHSLSQRWTQIGRNPAAALGDIAPNIGSVVAIEKDKNRRVGQVFPTFISLNSPSGANGGYFPAAYSPFHVNEAVTSSGFGLPNTTNPLSPTSPTRLDDMYSRLHQLDDPLRVNSPLGQPVTDFDGFYSAAKGLTYNGVVKQAFAFNAADSARYGATPFGNSCLVAKQVLQADQGTRFVQLSFGSWDFHMDIYGQQNPKGQNMYTMGKQLDDGVSALLADLKASGLLDQTLVVMAAEFGRTVGPLTAAGGRDHWPQQSIIFAGAGVKGGKVIGSTTADGSDMLDPGWSRQRYIRPEDVEATIYSAVGIDWTTVRRDDPFGRGFEYVPFSSQNLYGPIDELWQ